MKVGDLVKLKQKEGDGELSMPMEWRGQVGLIVEKHKHPLSTQDGWFKVAMAWTGETRGRRIRVMHQDYLEVAYETR